MRAESTHAEPVGTPLEASYALAEAGDAAAAPENRIPVSSIANSQERVRAARPRLVSEPALSRPVPGLHRVNALREKLRSGAASSKLVQGRRDIRSVFIGDETTCDTTILQKRFPVSKY
jgi:hypothetical protein